MQALCLLWQLPVLRQKLLPENSFRKEDSRFILFFLHFREWNIYHLKYFILQSVHLLYKYAVFVLYE